MTGGAAVLRARAARWSARRAPVSPTAEGRAQERRAMRSLIQAAQWKDRAYVAMHDARDHNEMVAAAEQIAAEDRVIAECQRVLDQAEREREAAA